VTDEATGHAIAAKLVLVRVERIYPHPANVRETVGDVTELTRSIREHGILQPLVVEPHPGHVDHGDSVFRLLAGHRRLAAAKRAGMVVVPVVIRRGVDDATAIELMLVENCQRTDLNPVEKAEAFQSLVHRGHTQTQIAKRTGISGGTVSYYLALMDLAPETRERVRAGKLSAADAVAAVRKVRRQDRRRKGSTATFKWEPDHLSATHPLAVKARRLCDAREHGQRRRLGKTACGQCWESVIRIDERVVIEAEETDPRTWAPSGDVPTGDPS
jgi:ParB family transcriptional regulator, chromosome partitioning protein